MISNSQRLAQIEIGSELGQFECVGMPRRFESWFWTLRLVSAQFGVPSHTWMVWAHTMSSGWKFIPTHSNWAYFDLSEPLTVRKHARDMFKSFAGSGQFLIDSNQFASGRSSLRKLCVGMLWKLWWLNHMQFPKIYRIEVAPASMLTGIELFQERFSGNPENH